MSLRRCSRVVPSVALATVLNVCGVSAMAADAYDLSWHTFAAGGGAVSAGAFQLAGTIGQPEAGVEAAGGVFTLRGGFWSGVQSTDPTPTPTMTAWAPGTPTSTETPVAPSITVTPTSQGGGVTPTSTPTSTFTPTLVTPTPTISATPTGPVTPTPTATPIADVTTIAKCQNAIVKASTGFVQARLAALQKCETKIVAGKFAGPCPDGDPATAKAIADDFAKLQAAIGKACGGKHKTCGGADTGVDSDVARTVVGFPPVCPGFEGDCTDAIGEHDCGDIASCLACIGGAAVDQAIGLYNDVALSDPKAAKTLNGCQQAIGKSAAKLFTAQSKALEKCWGDVIDGKIAGPCPDAAKADPAIAGAKAQFQTAVAKACCGKNKTCNLLDGGVNADFDPVAALGFPSTCASVSIPSGAACDGAITDMPSLIACLACMTDFKATCVSAAQVPAFVSPYPAECE